MSSPLSFSDRAVGLSRRSCNSLDHLATLHNADGIAALGNQKPWVAYMCIRDAWRRSLSIGSLRIVSLEEQLPEGIALNLDSKTDTLAVHEWIEGYLPHVSDIVNPLHLALYSLTVPTLNDRLRGRSVQPHALRAEFVVPPVET